MTKTPTPACGGLIRIYDAQRDINIEGENMAAHIARGMAPNLRSDRVSSMSL